MASQGGMELYPRKTTAIVAITSMKGPLKYIVVFGITCAVFGIAWFASSQLNARKFAKLKAEQEKISIGILSSETQFDLQAQDTCDAQSVFSQDLATLAQKISFAETNVASVQDVATLKKQYTLLQVRDYLLGKRVAEECKKPFRSILYFYGTSVGCTDCVKQGYVLDALRQTYPDVRIYAFDYNLDLDTIRALRSIYGIKDTLPALVINGTNYSGYRSLSELESLIK
jgi:glutaredoxin